MAFPTEVRQHVEEPKQPKLNLPTNRSAPTGTRAKECDKRPHLVECTTPPGA